MLHIKNNLLIVFLIFFFATESVAQKDLFEATRLYNEGVQTMGKGNYPEADSLFSLSIKTCANTDAYFNRALTRNNLGNEEGFCHDIYMASANGDTTARNTFLSHCTEKDTAYFDSSGNASDQANAIKTVVTARHKFDSNIELIIDSLGTKYWIYDTTATSLSDSSFNFVEQLPVFPGNDDGLVFFIYKNFKFPPNNKSIKDTVIVSFDITKEGNVENAKITKSVNEKIDNEALRIIGLMPRWFPAINNGKFIGVLFQLPIFIK